MTDLSAARQLSLKLCAVVSRRARRATFLRMHEEATIDARLVHDLLELKQMFSVLAATRCSCAGVRSTESTVFGHHTVPKQRLTTDSIYLASRCNGFHTTSKLTFLISIITPNKIYFYATLYCR